LLMRIFNVWLCFRKDSAAALTEARLSISISSRVILPPFVFALTSSTAFWPSCTLVRLP
jgi:hypothetical protein